MNKFKKSQLLLFLSVLLISSCSKEDKIIPDASQENNIQGVEMELGEQLANPYSVTNMKKALVNLLKDGNFVKKSTSSQPNMGEELITATHLYINFKPKNKSDPLVYNPQRLYKH